MSTFKFDFDLDDVDDTAEILDGSIQNELVEARTEREGQPDPFAQFTVEELLEKLPPVISSSPVTAGSVTLSRRDLYDARFQLIAQGQENAEALALIENPSDLLPGVYEGGLRLWECSLDLVEYLDQEKDGLNYQGKRIIELGCGTAIPSVYILSKIFHAQPSTSKITELHVQDFNSSVLELITFPNLVLAWYMSPASTQYRESPQTNEEASSPASDPSDSIDIPITPELKSAFLASIKAYNLHLQFFSGSWKALKTHNADTAAYDIVLTSETIYNTESLASLVELLLQACGKSDSPGLEERAAKLSISAPHSQKLCLVAAKVLYFGVGGGIGEFTRVVQERQGEVQTVLEKTLGVGRKVLSVRWGDSLTT